MNEFIRRRGPARGGRNLLKVVDFSQTAGAVPIAAAPSVHGLPKRHGWIELAETLPTSHQRASGSDVGARNRYRAIATLRTERTPSPSCMNIMHRRAIRASLWNHSSWQPSIPLWYAPQPRASHVLSRLTHSRSLRFAMLDRVLCRTRIDENRGLAACWKPPTAVVRKQTREKVGRPGLQHVTPSRGERKTMDADLRRESARSAPLLPSVCEPRQAARSV